MSTSHVERMRTTLASLADPLMEQYKEVEEQISVLDREMNELKEVRTQLRNAIRGINPDLIPVKQYASRQNGKPKQTRSANATGYGVSESMVSEMYDYLVEHREEIDAAGGIHAMGLANNPEFTIIGSQSQISKCFQVLRDRGQVRLVKRQGMGGAKYFKVVA